MADRVFFARSKNNVIVTYDPVHSHAATHFADTPQIIPYVKDTLRETVIAGELMEFDTAIGHVIGQSSLVATDDSDIIVYAIRKNRDRYARFTKSRSAQPATRITISLVRLANDTYDLYSAWLGPLTPSFPDSPHATAASRPFWATHALVWGSQEVQPDSETTICPW